MTNINREQAVSIAMRWDCISPLGDPGLVMYALSTTGRVQSEGHRAKLLAYIDNECQERAEKMGFMPTYDPEHELDQIRDYIIQAPIEMVEKTIWHLAIKI